MEYHAQYFEAFMLVCFGSSWPFSVAKTLKTKTVSGKSIVFLVLIFLGYLAGIFCKLISGPEPVIVLYTLNGSIVLTEIILYFRYKNPRRHYTHADCVDA